MNSKEIIEKINKEFNFLKYKNYDRKSFFAGYLIGYFKKKLEK